MATEVGVIVELAGPVSVPVTITRAVDALARPGRPDQYLLVMYDRGAPRYCTRTLIQTSGGGVPPPLYINSGAYFLLKC